ncbi:MAG: serine hydrolase [Clostridia bacterium]|nr:serine hydrolase [Clostridia bacterium]
MTQKEYFASLEPVVEEELERFHCPSLALGVIRKGEILFSGGFGQADREKGLPAGSKTLYQIGSSSKAFTAALCAILVDEGKLSWDQPVREIAPEIRFYDAFTSDNVTLRDLLCHRTGVPRHEYSWYGNDFTRAELVEHVRYLEPNHPFRSIMQYNNYGYVLAGALIEKVTGLTWEACLEKYLFGPLGMTRTTAWLDDIEGDPDHAAPYGSLKEGMTEPPLIPFYRTSVEDKEKGIGAPFGPAGSINSCPEDMLKWLCFHLGDGTWEGKKILSPEALNELHKPAMLMTEPLDMPMDESTFHTYALGWFVEMYRGHKVVHHGGNINGFSAEVFMVPDLELGLVALTNADSCFLHLPLIRTIVDHYLEIEDGDWFRRYLEFTEKMTGSAQEIIRAMSGDQVAGTALSHPLEAYTGEYERAGYGPCSVKAEDGKLLLHILGVDIPLTHFHYDMLTTEGIVGELPPGIPVRFQTADKGGGIDALTMPLVPNGELIRFVKKEQKE